MIRIKQLRILIGALAWGVGHAADLPGINDLPDIKEGLWVSTTMMPGAMPKPQRSTMCNSNAVTRKMYLDTHKNPNTPCKLTHSEHNGSVFTSETECNFGGKVTHSKSVTTVTGNTAMHLEMRKADNSLETVIDMKWVGACPAGMKLGDITGPDGKVMFNAMTP